MARSRNSRGAVPERALNLIAGTGLLALFVFGFVSWRASGEPFPADMRRSTSEIQRRGHLLAGHLDPSPPPDDAGVAAIGKLAYDMRVDVRWDRGPASDLLRRLEADSLDVVAGYDALLPGSEAYGLTRPYSSRTGSRHVLAVPSGENRLLQLADRAVRELARPNVP